MVCSQERNPISGRRTVKGRPFSSIVSVRKCINGRLKKIIRTKYVGNPEEDTDASVHGPSQAGATKRANEDEDPRPVETVGTVVIHICWLLER